LDRLRGKMYPRKPREDPYRLALELIDERYWAHGQSIHRYHAGLWWTWDGTRYRSITEEEMEAIVTAFTQKEFNVHQETGERSVGEETPLSPELSRFDTTLAKGEAVFLCDTALLRALAPLASLEPGRYELYRNKAKEEGIRVAAMDRIVKTLAGSVKPK